MKQRLCALCAAVVLAVCCLGLVRLLGTPGAPELLPVPSAAPDERPVLALFGASTDPWWEELSDGLDRWADEQGWALLAYDCRGNPTAQKGQVEDLVRREQADVAVLCGVGDGEQLAGCAQTLSEAKVPVIVLSRRSVGDVEGAACRVCPEDGEPYGSIADWFGRGGLLLLADVPDDPEVETAREALEDSGARVLDWGACWGGEEYAADYLTRALGSFPGADGVVAFSRAGALGAKDALDGRDVPVLCLEYGPAVEEDLALGELDAAVEVSAQEALRALETCIPKVRSGDAEALYPLSVHIRTGRADT